MTSATRRAGVPPIIQREVRLRVWVAVMSGMVAVILLTYLGHRWYVETAAQAAHRAGTLVPQSAEVVAVDYPSATSSLVGGSSQQVRYRLPGGSEQVSLLRDRDEFLTLDEGRTVRLGLWQGHLVTVEGQYVRALWTPGALLVFLLPPPAIVLTVLQVHRLRRLRKERWEYPFDDESNRGYMIAAALVALGAGVVALSIGGDGWWLPAVAMGVSVLGPLAWFAVRENGRASRRSARVAG
ncbi:hypothetical protein [Micromonospora fluostatini]|uniref:hypothetical protein n=1 Tax=Micromonospora sp. JCM 30529 TaxID=3421643 RepID=UPI003D182945